MHHNSESLTRQAITATRHCLTGCAIGEVLGMVITNAANLGAVASVAVSTALAFGFGYGLTIAPLLRTGLGLRKALGLALAADTVSIATMELSDNGFIVLVPGAINAGLTTALFWVSLAVSLIVAFIITVPVNRILIKKGLGHAVIHHYH
ncbi:MAG TPA: DUF4396 domain-containing protein [Candidatus Saccharimonadia bacterium]|jgi:hypothetical protein|nr:DUF4396 domain-containing protein [Candidatus Saccharimonadia bacterium]